MDKAQMSSDAARPDILDEARAACQGERQRDYGDFAKTAKRTAEMWNAYLSERLPRGQSLRATDVGHMMILLKEARAAHSPTHRDTLVDIAGFAYQTAGMIEPHGQEKR